MNRTAPAGLTSGWALSREAILLGLGAEVEVLTKAVEVANGDSSALPPSSLPPS